MKYISQNCENSSSQETKIKEIQSKITSLGVVLAVAHTFDDGNFVASILINRRGIEQINKTPILNFVLNAIRG